MLPWKGSLWTLWSNKVSFSPALSLRLLGCKETFWFFLRGKLGGCFLISQASRTEVEMLMIKGQTLGINNKSGFHGHPSEKTDCEKWQEAGEGRIWSINTGKKPFGPQGPGEQSQQVAQTHSERLVWSPHLRHFCQRGARYAWLWAPRPLPCTCQATWGIHTNIRRWFPLLEHAFLSSNVPKQL